MITYPANISSYFEFVEKQANNALLRFKTEMEKYLLAKTEWETKSRLYKFWYEPPDEILVIRKEVACNKWDRELNAIAESQELGFNTFPVPADSAYWLDLGEI